MPVVFEEGKKGKISFLVEKVLTPRLNDGPLNQHVVRYPLQRLLHIVRLDKQILVFEACLEGGGGEVGGLVSKNWRLRRSRRCAKKGDMSRDSPQVH